MGDDIHSRNHDTGAAMGVSMGHSSLGLSTSEIGTEESAPPAAPPSPLDRSPGKLVLVGGVAIVAALAIGFVTMQMNNGFATSAPGNSKGSRNEPSGALASTTPSLEKGTSDIKEETQTDPLAEESMTDESASAADEPGAVESTNPELLLANPSAPNETASERPATDGKAAGSDPAEKEVVKNEAASANRVETAPPISSDTSPAEPTPSSTTLSNSAAKSAKPLRSPGRLLYPAVYWVGDIRGHRLNAGRFATIAKRFGACKGPVLVSGHSDSSGDQRENVSLSEQRAEWVKSQLVAQGIPETDIRARGLGSSQPRDSNETIDGRRKNRRVTIECASR